ERLLAIAERRIQLTSGVARAAAVAPGVGQARVELDGFGVIGQRGVKIAELLSRRPAIVPGVSVARVEFDGAAEVGKPGGAFAPATARQPATEESPDQTGVERKRLIEIPQRAVEIAFACPRHSTVVVSACVSRVKDDGERVIGDGSLELALIEPAVAAIEVRG